MTGAGSSELAFVKESSFKTLPGSPTYYEPGRDPVVQDVTLERALSEQRQPNQVFADEAVAGNLEGAFTVEFTVDQNRQSDVHDIVFNSTAPYTLTSGLAATSRWYLGLDYLTGTAERELIGTAPLDFRLSYQQGGDLRCTLTMLYADEDTNTSITPSSITEATGASARWHGADFTIDGTVQSKEQAAELSISNISRFQRGSSAIATEAVVGPAAVEFTMTSIFTETDQLELAYGGAGSTSTSASMSNVAGDWAVSAGGSTIATYNLAEMKPDAYSWQDLVNAESDVTEDVRFVVTGDPAVTVT